MLQVALIILLLGVAVFLGFKAKRHEPGKGKVKKVVFQVGSGLAGALALVIFISMSVLWVAKDEIVILDKVYWGSQMPTGQIVANSDEKGPQAKVLNPGFHFIPMVRFEYDLESAPVVTINPNQYGIVTAKDGAPLREGQVIADEWDNYNDMIDAEKFLAKGQKGMQLTVLPPGQYR